MRHYMDDGMLVLAGQLAALAIQEDIADGDLTANALLSSEKIGKAELLIKQDGILSGAQWAEIVLKRLDPSTKVSYLAVDGDRLKAGAVVAKITATEKALISGERTALNLIQRLSGIATLTGRFMDAREDTRALIFDTRKTTPGLRVFEKYAVRCGGGANHRMGLYDEMMIKENHLYLSGLDLKTAIERCRESSPDVRLTAEAESVAEAKLGVDAGADILLLDEFTPEQIKEVLEYRGNSDDAIQKTQIEISGGVNLDTIEELAKTGAERISIGAITHSAPALDLSLKVIRDK
ncbi:MAG: carboxylating nicotinate-nucleotide diphosphorylase [Planctomycetes bacterium]|nr:carboxylating nicotinate-nucleotide diphosphorylase [Planctomycetota bacterium]